MDSSKPAVTPLAVDRSRIGAICEEEWESFLSDYDETPVPDVQDRRAFFLNWIAVFHREAFPNSLQAQMATWLVKQFAQADAGWSFVRPPLIGSTLFALTDERYWLQIQVDNFADGGSLVRSFLHKSLALVAPHVKFDDRLLRQLDFGMNVPIFLHGHSLGHLCRCARRCAGEACKLQAMGKRIHKRGRTSPYRRLHQREFGKEPTLILDS